MKLKHRWCPKGCRVPGGRRKRQLMHIISTPEKHRYQSTGRGGATRYDLLLDWICPTCFHTEPVNSKDIRGSSRRTKWPHGLSHHRQAYGLKLDPILSPKKELRIKHVEELTK